MNINEAISAFSIKYVDELIEDNFFDIKYIENNFDMKQVLKTKGEICMLCLEDMSSEEIGYKCIECSCHLHHSCLNNYAKSYSMTHCIQCKHMHSSVFYNTDF